MLKLQQYLVNFDKKAKLKFRRQTKVIKDDVGNDEVTSDDVTDDEKGMNGT